jgi:hypothetical protein
MTDLEMDFRAPVAKAYELRRADELGLLMLENRPVRFVDVFPPRLERLPDLRYLVPVGESRLVRPKRRAMDFAIGLLLKTPMPKSVPSADRAGAGVESLAQEDVAALERNVLLIAKHIGPLWGDLEDKNAKTHTEPIYESLSQWVDLADRIQTDFERDSPADYLMCSVAVYLTRQRDGSRSMVVRPSSTREALKYHAAQMIARGAVSRTCEHCGTLFLTGKGGGEKRGGARFCSDKCRYSYHNEANRKLRG